MTDEVKQNDFVSKADFERLENMLMEVLTKPQPKVEEVKQPSTIEANKLAIEEEKSLQSKMKQEIMLQDFFEDDSLYNYNEDEKRAFTGASKEEIEVENIKRLLNSSDVISLMPNKEVKKYNEVMKNGSLNDKLAMKFDFLESFKEAKEKLDNINKKKEEEFGVELSKKGYSTKKSDTFTVDKINDGGLRKLLGNIDSKYFN
mgnify:CR=1 FL=1